MHDGASAAQVHHTVALEGDEFMLAVPGASGTLVRTGIGDDTATVTTFTLGETRLAMLEIGFPAAAEAYGEDDSMILCTMLRTPAPGSWDGVPLAAGQTFVYPPRSSHHASDPAGLRFAMSVFTWGDFEAAAVDLGYDPAPATRRHNTNRGQLFSLLSSMESGELAGVTSAGTAMGADTLLEAAVRTVCSSISTEDRQGRGWDDSELVHDALMFLEQNEAWRVPILTLCRDVGVSERRLQMAFRNLLGVTPTQFMRDRALQAAYRTLLISEPDSVDVTTVARSHGFGHVGRFAAYYRGVYGELPTQTLRRSRKHVRASNIQIPNDSPNL